MNKNFSFLCILITIIIVSCTSSKKTTDAKENALFNQWIGHSKNQLVKQWGQPDSTKSDGKKGEILIYKEDVDYVSVMNEKYSGKQYSIRKEMFVNADSLIYYWKAWRRK